MNDLLGIIVLKDFDFFDIFTIQFNLEDTDGLFHCRQERLEGVWLLLGEVGRAGAQASSRLSLRICWERRTNLLLAWIQVIIQQSLWCYELLRTTT